MKRLLQFLFCQSAQSARISSSPDFEPTIAALENPSANVTTHASISTATLRPEQSLRLAPVGMWLDYRSLHTYTVCFDNVKVQFSLRFFSSADSGLIAAYLGRRTASPLSSQLYCTPYACVHTHQMLCQVASAKCGTSVI